LVIFMIVLLHKRKRESKRKRRENICG